MFEFGGSKYSSGTAMVIATPSGFPNSAIVLKQRKKNGLHVSSKVWMNCLVGIAHHQYGITNVGIYQVKKISKLDNDNNEVTLELLTGLAQASPEQTRDTGWYNHHCRKYPGLKKLVNTLLEKLEMFECTTPMYFEPFRILRRYTRKDADFDKLMLDTNLEIDESVPDLVPRYILIEKNMAEIEEYKHFYQFEQALLEVCRHLAVSFPYVYVLYCHHPDVKTNGLITHAFISFQENEGKTLVFHRTGYVYHHSGIESGRSTDLEAFIKSNYNDSYLHGLLGVHGGGINKLMKHIETSKDGCIYVPLKYALCTKKYTHR